ncbi:hypothetical protein BJV74DRAFT_496194 [Russula compacta]|nr:hypothetical protein BJV74DRAFT_496194 [Russula compacta]
MTHRVVTRSLRNVALVLYLYMVVYLAIIAMNKLPKQDIDMTMEYFMGYKTAITSFLIMQPPGMIPLVPLAGLPLAGSGGAYYFIVLPLLVLLFLGFLSKLLLYVSLACGILIPFVYLWFSYMDTRPTTTQDPGAPRIRDEESLLRCFTHSFATMQAV